MVTRVVEVPLADGRSILVEIDDAPPLGGGEGR